MTVTVACVYWGNKFSLDYVYNLKAAVEKNTTVPHKFVVYSNLGYNTVKGGGFGWTNSQLAFDLGTGYLDPFNIKGEILAGVTWARPLDREVPDPVRDISTDIIQGTFEFNWSLLLTPNFWITPGYQLVWNPSFAPDTKSIHLPQFKFRIFL